MNKYRNRKTVVDGITFDSRKEAARWQELRWMEQCGIIYDLRRQVPYVLIEGHRGQYRTERKRVYIADFVYIEDGQEIVEDCKGVRTDTYKLKRALMLEKYGISIKES